MRRNRQLMGTLLLGASRRQQCSSHIPNKLHVCGLMIRHDSYYSTTTSCAEMGHANPPADPPLSSPSRNAQSQRQRLNEETKQLLQTLTTNNNKEEEGTTKRRVTSQKCYKLVEEWMQLAKKHQDQHAAIQCQELVQFLEQHYATTPLEPTKHFYDLVLQALCATGQVQSAHALLLQNASLQSSSKRNIARVSAKSFHIVMNGWAKQKKQNSGMRAEELYQQMESLYYYKTAKDKDLKPNHRSLTALLDAWANSGHKEAHDRIRNLLQQTLERKQQQLDLVGFHTVLQALSTNNSNDSRSNPSRRAAETCEHILHIMMEQQDLVKPNAQTYSLVIHAWAQCEASERQGRAAERAERILHHMMNLNVEGGDVKPNIFTFTTCMAAWSRCHQPERAQQLLNHLVDLYEKTKDAELKPDTAAGNAVILAWSRSNQPDAVDKTKEALAKLQSFAPADLVSYNAMLHAYSRVGMFEAALALVQQLEQQDDTLLPDVVSYNCLLNALAKSDIDTAGVQAEEILERMQHLALDQRPSVNPTSASYTSVVQAYFKSSSPSDAVNRVYKQALDSGAKLDAVFFVAVLQAYAKEREQKEEAWNMAIEAFDGALRKFPGPLQISNDRMSVAMLDTCHQLVDSRNEWYHIIAKVLDHSKGAGIVSRRLLASLRRCAGNDQRTMCRLLGHNKTQVLPRMWSREIPARHRP
jgi:pentatricopeptide repeat protein